jgi:regulatory protein
MIITGLEELTKSRSKVMIDGEFAFVLYKGELRHFHLQVGEELSQEDYEEIRTVILPKRAKLRAMNLLLKKDYTTAKLRAKLLEGGYPPEIAQEALDYVASFHYTDDLRYAVDYITCHQDDRSRLRIEQDLRAKGISGDVLERAFIEWENAGGCQDEVKMIRDLFRKRGFDPENASPAEQNREYAFLMRKGFSADSIRNAIFHSFT